MISTAVVLYQDQGDCTTVPLRLWLEVFGLASFVNLNFSFLCEMCLVDKVGKSRAYKVVYLIFMTSQLAWICAGIFWYFMEPSCADTFVIGYKLARVFTYIFLILFGLILAILGLVIFSSFKRKSED